MAVHCEFTVAQRGRTLSTLYDFNIRVPAQHRDTVFGFVRSQEKQCALCAVPSLVKCLVLRYYFHGQHFNKCSRSITISDRSRTATRHIRSRWAMSEPVAMVHPPLPLLTSHGRYRHSVCRWTFQMDRVDLLESGAISVGIATFSSESAHRFVFKSFFDRIEFKTGARDEMNGAGDRIFVHLNTKQNAMSVQIESKQRIWKSLGIEGAFSDDHHRQLAVRLLDVNTIITLRDFSCVVEDYCECKDSSNVPRSAAKSKWLCADNK